MLLTNIFHEDTKSLAPDNRRKSRDNQCFHFESLLARLKGSGLQPVLEEGWRAPQCSNNRERTLLTTKAKSKGKGQSFQGKARKREAFKDFTAHSYQGPPQEITSSHGWLANRKEKL